MSLQPERDSQLADLTFQSADIQAKPKENGMSICSINKPKNTSDEVTNKLRNAFIHRALWMGLILKEVKERGLDWEDIGHAAIFSTGCMHGEGIKERMDTPDSMIEFADKFLNEDVKKVFEMEIKKLDESELRVEFGYCPLVTAWTQAGIEGDMLKKLCNIAMSGDRGIGSRFENFDFHLGKTIAEGNKVCEVAFVRKK